MTEDARDGRPAESVHPRATDEEASPSEPRGSGAPGEAGAPPTAEPPAPEPGPVKRHHGIVRFTHWAAALLLAGMVTSGLQIYGAYTRFGERGGPYYPNPFQGRTFPEAVRLGGWLAGGINWHFLLMWPLVAVGLLYVGYLLISGEWRKLVFRPRDVRPAIEMQKYYLRLRKDHPPQGKHNALQKLAYTGTILLGTLSVATGFAIYKPVQLGWLTFLFGGYEMARYLHFLAVWAFVAFVVIHVVMVFVVDPASLRAILTGRYRGRFPSHTPKPAPRQKPRSRPTPRKAEP